MRAANCISLLLLVSSSVQSTFQSSGKGDFESAMIKKYIGIPFYLLLFHSDVTRRQCKCACSFRDGSQAKKTKRRFCLTVFTEKNGKTDYNLHMTLHKTILSPGRSLNGCQIVSFFLPLSIGTFPNDFFFIIVID